MDNSTLIRVSQFRTMAAHKGKLFDVVRFATDREFALPTLTQILANCDEELRAAGMALKEAMQLTPGSAAPSARLAAHAAEHPSEPPETAPAAPPAAPRAPKSDTDANFRSHRSAVVRNLNEATGPLCEELAIRMERTLSEDELRPLIAQATKIVESVRGKEAARAFVARCGDT